MTDDEIIALFKYVTKSKNTVGVNLSVQKLSEKVFYAVDAILIEKMKYSVSGQLKSLSELLLKHDANRD